MGWYRVTKRVNGRRYLYLQRTYRVGKLVKTENIYIGPATSLSSSSPNESWHGTERSGDQIKTSDKSIEAPSRGASLSQYEQTVSEHRDLLANADFTPPPPEPPEPEPTKDDYTPDGWREILAFRRQEKREFDAAMKIVKAKVRKAKRETRGIKAANPFLAKALKKD